MTVQTQQSFPYSWVEPLFRPHRGWPAFRVVAVPALIVACVAWFGVPRIRTAISFDRDFAADLVLLLVLGGFELMVLVTFAIDRRKVTLDRNGLRLAGAGGLLPGRTIALSSISAIGLESEPDTPSVLRLRASGIRPEDGTIGLGKSQRNVREVMDRFQLLGIGAEAAVPLPSPPLRNPVLGRIIIYALIASNFFALPGTSGSSDDELHTPAPIDLDPSIHCVVAKSGGLLSIDVANVERLIEVKIQSYTIAPRDVRTERIGPSLTRLTLHHPQAENGISDEAEPSETLTVVSRSADGTTHSGWTTFNPKDDRLQGYQCS